MSAAPSRDPSGEAAGLDLVETRRGVRLRLRVRAGGRANAIVGFHGGALKLTVTPPPERGKANRAVIALLAKRLGLAAGAVEIVSGAGSPDKVVELPIDRDRLLDRLRAG